LALDEALKYVKQVGKANLVERATVAKRRGPRSELGLELFSPNSPIFGDGRAGAQAWIPA
jgi:hypothetical protein